MAPSSGPGIDARPPTTAPTSSWMESAEEREVVDPLVAAHPRTGDEGEHVLRKLRRIGLQDKNSLYAPGQRCRPFDEARGDHRQREGGEGEVERGQPQGRNAEKEPDQPGQES